MMYVTNSIFQLNFHFVMSSIKLFLTHFNSQESRPSVIIIIDLFC